MQRTLVPWMQTSLQDEPEKLGSVNASADH